MALLSDTQRIYIISSEPISKRPASNSFQELNVTSMSKYLIGSFWLAIKKELYEIVGILADEPGKKSLTLFFIQN